METQLKYLMFREQTMMDKGKIRRALSWERWKSFYELNPPNQEHGTKAEPSNKAGCGKLLPNGSAASSGLTPNARTLGYDIITYPDSQFSERQKRLDLSVRQLENAKKELLDLKLIKEIWLGKSLLLAPTSRLYTTMEIPSPYTRNVSDVHSFLVLLTERLIQANPLVKYTRREVSIGDSNKTVDLIAYLKSGQRLAYEIIHHNTTNITALAARLEGKGYSELIFVATDYSTKQRVWAIIKNAGFDPDFLSTIRCTIFSSLIRQKKQMMLKEMR
jgi:hypothetical protein